MMSTGIFPLLPNFKGKFKWSIHQMSAMPDGCGVGRSVGGVSGESGEEALIRPGQGYLEHTAALTSRS